MYDFIMPKRTRRTTEIYIAFGAEQQTPFVKYRFSHGTVIPTLNSPITLLAANSAHAVRISNECRYRHAFRKSSIFCDFPTGFLTFLVLFFSDTSSAIPSSYSWQNISNISQHFNHATPHELHPPPPCMPQCWLPKIPFWPAFSSGLPHCCS